MQTERQVKLFRNGRNQAVRIPREFELDGNEAIMRQVGNCLVIEPIKKPGLLATLASWSDLDDAFPDVDEDLGGLDEPEL